MPLDFKELIIVWTVRRDKFTLVVISFIVTLLFSVIRFRIFASFTVQFTVQSSFALNPFLSKGMVKTYLSFSSFAYLLFIYSPFFVLRLFKLWVTPQNIKPRPISKRRSGCREQFAVQPYAFLLIEAHFPFCTLVLIRFRAEKAVSSFHEWTIQTFKIAPHFIKTIYFFRLRLNTRECKLLPKKPPNAFSLASTSLLPAMPLQMHLTPIRIEPSYPLPIGVFIDYRRF